MYVYTSLGDAAGLLGLVLVLAELAFNRLLWPPYFTTGIQLFRVGVADAPPTVAGKGLLATESGVFRSTPDGGLVFRPHWASPATGVLSVMSANCSLRHTDSEPVVTARVSPALTVLLIGLAAFGVAALASGLVAHDGARILGGGMALSLFTVAWWFWFVSQRHTVQAWAERALDEYRQQRA